MRRRWLVLAAALAACLAAGCGDNSEKGKYRDKDKPRSSDARGAAPGGGPHFLSVGSSPRW
jgi:hypothetical protein